MEDWEIQVRDGHPHLTIESWSLGKSSEAIHHMPLFYKNNMPHLLPRASNIFRGGHRSS
jgi:hypothetical protein